MKARVSVNATIARMMASGVRDVIVDRQDESVSGMISPDRRVTWCLLRLRAFWAETDGRKPADSCDHRDQRHARAGGARR